MRLPKCTFLISPCSALCQSFRYPKPCHRTHYASRFLILTVGPLKNSVSSRLPHSPHQLTCSSRPDLKMCRTILVAVRTALQDSHQNPPPCCVTSLISVSWLI